MQLITFSLDISHANWLIITAVSGTVSVPIISVSCDLQKEVLPPFLGQSNTRVTELFFHFEGGDSRFFRSDSNNL
jgi:hypothetical protein